MWLGKLCWCWWVSSGWFLEKTSRSPFDLSMEDTNKKKMLYTKNSLYSLTWNLQGKLKSSFLAISHRESKVSYLTSKNWAFYVIVKMQEHSQICIKMSVYQTAKVHRDQMTTIKSTTYSSITLCACELQGCNEITISGSHDILSHTKFWLQHNPINFPTRCYFMSNLITKQ